MDSSTIKRYEMFKHVSDFGQAHASDFATGTLTKELFSAMAQIVADLENQRAHEFSWINVSSM